MSPRRLSLAFLAALGLVAACGKKAAEPLRISTAPTERRTIVVQAEATGIIEPINVVEVKSRASGQITEMPVETGTLVNPGALIVQLDTRDVQNQFDQAKADLESSEASLAVAEQNKKRSDELFRAQIITAQENEQAGLTYQNALSQIVRARTNLDLAQQRLEDARVVAPVRGTIIEKPVALGQVIQSGTQAVGGGTTIVKMADLTKVRARALVNETDIGRVTAGQEATVIVDAFPDRPFRGVVEKIEPQAVVQQNVTMFPVLVSLENREGLLLPGMNGEVSIISDRRENVLSIPNEAIRSVREAAQVAALPDVGEAVARRMTPA
ncbi:MAG TPA: efflux RND transporter periplasmic adaptor subunit, partial [Gemmatimonadaceae bacterium]|nr:efflux RND transporter periplasmic adaptor subunit [Gemmatimonadaceae bacterium]